MKQFPRLPRLEILVIAGACLAAFLVTLLILSSSSGGSARRAAEAARQEPARPQKQPILGLQDLAVNADDFLLPPAPGAQEPPTYTPFRPRVSRWSAEMVRSYWIPPRDIAIDILKSMNDLDMEKLFEKVP